MKFFILITVLSILVSCGSTPRLYDGEKIKDYGITEKKNYTGHYFIVEDNDTIFVSPREYKQHTK